MGIFVVTYGIMQQSLQYPNENRMNFTIKVRHVFRADKKF